jgi:prepilin-type N-terminal cleavage/methylation domain-containing protein
MQKSELKKGIALSRPKGFTLIELLIVIGILAILATVTLLVLNPAQMFAQARDSQRISDLNTVKSAISLYLSTASTPSLDGTQNGTNCGSKFWGTFGTTTEASQYLFGNNNARSFTYATATTTVDGNGWVPVALNTMSGGSPISSLPLDPSGVSNGTNTTAAQAYYYACSTTQMTFKLVGNMESARYASAGPDDKESTDGGTNPAYYETGTNISSSL